MEFVPKSAGYKITPGQWSGYTLILPCVSVANVPQLTVDLLVSENVKTQEAPSRDLELVGSLWSENVFPFAGVDPYVMNGKDNATAIQVFVSDTKKLIIIQQRSPVYKDRREDFYAELSNFLSSHALSNILILSSSFDQFLVPELHKPDEVPVKCIGHALDDSLKDYLKKTPRIAPVSPVDPETMIPTDKGRIYLPGSGSTRGYMKLFPRIFPNTPVLCLILFCSEGENRFHAMVFADVIADLLNREKSIVPVKSHQGQGSKVTKYFWEAPWSWRRMYGTEPPSSMF